MQGKVEAVGQDKQGQYGPYTSVKVGGVWYTVNGTGAEWANKEIKFDVQDKGKYKVGKNVEIVETAPPAGASGASGTSQAGAVPLSEWMVAMRELHKIAAELEPDELANEGGDQTTGGEAHTVPLVKVDRSMARAAILNTCMIALSNGKIDMTDDVPF